MNPSSAGSICAAIVHRWPCALTDNNISQSSNFNWPKIDLVILRAAKRKPKAEILRFSIRFHSELFRACSLYLNRIVALHAARTHPQSLRCVLRDSAFESIACVRNFIRLTLFGRLALPLPSLVCVSTSLSLAPSRNGSEFLSVARRARSLTRLHGTVWRRYLCVGRWLRACIFRMINTKTRGIIFWYFDVVVVIGAAILARLDRLEQLSAFTCVCMCVPVQCDCWLSARAFVYCCTMWLCVWTATDHAMSLNFWILTYAS